MKKVKRNFLMSLLIGSLLLMTHGVNAQFGTSARGNGKVVSNERTVGDFTAISINSSADVKLIQGNKTKVVVKTDENIQQNVTTEVSGGVLTIDTKGRFTAVKELTVFVTVENLERVRINGSGDFDSEGVIRGNELEILINGSGDVEMDLEMKSVVTHINGSGDVELSGIQGNLELFVNGSGDFEADGVRLDQCNITVNGSGNVKLNGSANDVKLNQSASGDINLFNLKANNMVADSRGSGDMVVSVSGNLKVSLRGSGDLTYYGEPTSISTSAKGSGGVYHR
jgi:hypothetical protein